MYRVQEEAIKKLLQNKVGALFMKMGTGKTRVAIELINAVADLDLIIWIAPLRTIYPIEKTSTIIDEVNKWGGFNCNDVIYMGIETLQSSDRKYLNLYDKVNKSKKCFIVVDESIKIKNIEANRTKRLLELSRMVEYKIILNGEPITRDLLDIWAQFEFLDSEILNMRYPQFKNTFCKYTTITKKLGGYKTYNKEFITGYENIDYLYSLIGEYVYECDLELNVEQIFETQNYHLSKKEKETYNILKNTYLDNEKLQLINNNIFLEMTQKMQHGYCCNKEKIDLTRKWIKNESKTIIFCKYIASMDLCKKEFPKSLVLNYKNGSLGLNIQDRPYTVYFDQTFDWGDVIQSQHRNYRIGQEQDCRYLNLIGDIGLETLINNNNRKKINMSEYLKKISREQLIAIL